MDSDDPEFGYPYAPDDGRENPDAAASVARVVRGGSWNVDHSGARTYYRGRNYPDYRHTVYGFRLVVSGPRGA